MMPYPVPPAFQTVGEIAQRFGLKLRPGVDASVRIDKLPRSIEINQLFIDLAVEGGMTQGCQSCEPVQAHTGFQHTEGAIRDER
jgi:hypothetical protein